MDTKQLESALLRLFEEDDRRIVFWNDPDQEFLSLMNSPPMFFLEGVNVVRLDRMGALEAKILMERGDPTGRYLVYAPTEEPLYENDWLLDIRFFSRSFRADRASMIVDELKLVNQHLRQHIADCRKFFDNKERLAKLKPLVLPNDTDADLDRKMIAVVVRAEQPEWFNIILTLFHAFAENENGNEIDLDTPPAIWEQVERFDLDKAFWQTMKTLVGYTEDIPSLRNLLTRLLVTDYVHHVKADVPPSLQHLVLPRLGMANAVVCLGQWRDSSSKVSSYDRLATVVASILHIEDILGFRDIDSLLEAMTFMEVDKTIARSLRDRVASTADTINADDIRQIATRRQAGHWASLTVAGAAEVPRMALHAVYDAVVAAADFYALRNKYQRGFDYDTAQAMYRAYETELFRFDQLYRQFCEAADLVEAKSDVLKGLREKIEACYTHWYVNTLALKWSGFVDPQGSTALLNKWQIEGVPSQQRFFDEHIQKRLEEAERRRSFVIISDALRYEAAEELARELNGKYRFEADLSSQLSVLPSYTGLGMAALLPHQRLGYRQNGDVTADGILTTNFDQRNQVLAGADGLAVRWDELVAMRKEDGREFISGKRLVYIYHDIIDATGDSQKTEKDTFAAVRKAFDQLASVVAYVINSLNGNHIVITADHGFLFSETAPGEPEKSSLPDKPEGTVKAKKRYLLGHKLSDREGTWHGRTAITASIDGEMEFWIPRAANRFHFSGGARFIHGGAMLQEVCVPVVTVRHIKGKSVEDTKTKRVTVHVLGTNHKVTTSHHRFELIQMEPVSDRVKAVTLKVAIYEGEEPVTNVESVTFDNASSNMDERRKWVSLVLQSRQFDKKTSYHLVLRDAETSIEQQRVQVTIDRAFDDF